MRSSALFAVVVVSALAVACSGEDAELPEVVVISAEPALAEQAQAIADGVLQPQGMRAETAAVSTDADLVVSAEAGNDEDEFTTAYWVPVVQLPAPVEGLTVDQLEAAVSGETDNWAAIDGRDTALRVVVPTDPPPPLGAWFPEVTSDVDALPLDQISGALFTDPGALALLPLDAVNSGMLSLDIDGANAVFGTGDLETYPLTESRSVTAQDTESDQFDDILDEVATALTSGLAVAPPVPIILRATGDILPVRCTLEKLQALGDFTYSYAELGPWLAEANLAVGSLDAAVSDAGEPFLCTETFSLMGPAEAAEGFKFAGLDVMTVATNHVKDCGQAACGDDSFFDTLANLRANGVQPVGGGANIAEARSPVLLDVAGVRFAFLGYDEVAAYYHADETTPGTAPLLEEYIREDIAAADAVADVVVFQPQWGVEYTADPTLNQQTLAQAAVEAGADLIIGNHPHWVQAAQVIDDVFVAYALGNFLFDQDWSLETQQGAVLEAAFHGSQLRGVRYYPIHIYDETQPRFADDDEAQQIMDRIWNASTALF